jgi:hypothetical protein
MWRGRLQLADNLKASKRYACSALLELDPTNWVKNRLQMLRNRSNRDAIFVHIPKTAGTSLISILRRNGGMSLRDEKSLKMYFQNRGTVSFNHISIPSLLEADILSREYFEKAWKFAFVRNPYARTVSLYVYLIGELAIGDEPNPILPRSTTFSIFCSYLAQKAFEPIGLYNRNGLSQLNPQVTWLKDTDGRFFCDFVGKVESFEKDFECVSQALKLSTNGDGLPWENKTSRSSVQTYYSSREMEIVAKVYAEDFSRFGYDPYKLPEG